MTKTDPKRNKHLTLDDRNEIQECLNLGMKFKAIAMRLGKDQTTISKEVKKHLDVASDDVFRTDLNGKPITPEVCPALLKAPFVCNPCGKKRARCKYRKQFYRAKKAQQAYETLLSEAREGIPLNKEHFYEMDRILSEGVKRGQHLYHIMQTKELGVSKSTVYRHLNQGYLSVSPIDFPRVVKFKPRKQKPRKYVPKAVKLGRSHDDFLNFIEENNLTTWTEMDTVIGRVGGKAILTLNFTLGNLTAGILLNNKTAAETARKIQSLKTRFIDAGLCFGSVFPLILTDNGGEFADVFTIENGLDGLKETHLFFCDPMQPSQKPRVEKTHTLFRDIVPKGKSFDDFTQETVNLIFSHINSVSRKSLNGKTPLDVFTFTYGKTAAEVLGIRPVPRDQVIQTPKLLKILKDFC
jgi:IS30 family transposase